jgi:ribonuclease HI
MITIYTDGSSRGNPGPGGYGVIVIGENNVVELGGYEKLTTNNKMELSGAIEGLRFIQKLKKGDVTIKTDSQYVIKGMTEWIDGWIKRGWRGSTKKPVLNKELWEELLELSQPFKIKWEYVKGHAGIAGNERADEIATKFADRIDAELYTGPISNYPIKK